MTSTEMTVGEIARCYKPIELKYMSDDTLLTLFEKSAVDLHTSEHESSETWTSFFNYQQIRNEILMRMLTAKMRR